MSVYDKRENSLSWITDLLSNRSRPLGHVSFWLAVLIFYTLYFGTRQDGYGQSLLFLSLLLPITIATTYFLLYWLVPRYLLRQRYLLFSLYFLYTIVFSLYLELLLILLLFINVSDYQAMFVKPAIVDLLDVIVGMYLVVFLALSINLLKRWFMVQSTNAQLETARVEAELKLKNAELALLKSQIHPHFLFNTLNNLYALALTKSDRVPDVVLKISQQLDYMLYRSDQKKVSLKDEIDHIENHLALEALRYDDARVDVSFTKDGDYCNWQIAPLLLIPFVENCFKHGISQSGGPAWIKMHLSVSDKQLNFTVSNSKAEHPKAGSDLKKHASGIGLNNVQKRLDLLYPNQHTLDIKETTQSYEVHLKITLDESA